MAKGEPHIHYMGRRVEIREDWEDAGKQGVALAEPVWVKQNWVPVLWDGEEDPNFYKAAGLKIINPNDWKTKFAKEFHKYYDGILAPELIDGSIQWNIKFMEKYINEKNHNT